MLHHTLFDVLVESYSVLTPLFLLASTAQLIVLLHKLERQKPASGALGQH